MLARQYRNRYIRLRTETCADVCCLLSCRAAGHFFCTLLVIHGGRSEKFTIRRDCMQQKTILMDELAVDRALSRIAHEIIERNKGVEDLALVGVITRGAPMAKMLADKINRFEGVEVPCGSVDISLYRDDIEEISDMPVINGTDIGFDVKGKRIVLCDDVLFTGRTARAAMEAVLQQGRPKCIQLAVLVDRGHRELPVRADYVGKNVPTTLSEMIAVRFKQTDGEQNVVLFDLTK